MKVTVIGTYKTKKAADRLAADYNRFDSDLNFRTVKATDGYLVVRDYADGDERHGLVIAAVTA